MLCCCVHQGKVDLYPSSIPHIDGSDFWCCRFKVQSHTMRLQRRCMRAECMAERLLVCCVPPVVNCRATQWLCLTSCCGDVMHISPRSVLCAQALAMLCHAVLWLQVPESAFEVNFVLTDGEQLHFHWHLLRPAAGTARCKASGMQQVTDHAQPFKETAVTRLCQHTIHPAFLPVCKR
jgi:hypothetical protein